MALGKQPELAAIPSAPAEWYPDPDNASQWRYWDGTAWTGHYAPRDGGSSVARVDTATLESGMPTLAELVARARLEPPRHPLDEQVEVEGETYHIKGIK